jgi:hypothetical protein
MSVRLIQDTFVNHIVNGIAGFNLPPTFDVHKHIWYPNLPFTTPSAPWLRLNLITANPSDYAADGSCHFMNGIFEIGVYYPNNLNHANEHLRTCDTIAQSINQYPPGDVYVKGAAYVQTHSLSASEKYASASVMVPYQWQVNNA